MDGASPTFSPGQIAALDKCGDWHKNRTKEQQIFRLFGYAGTGKTTLARHLAEGLNGDIVYCAFTGKAALMMRRNGCHGAATIHSTIYTVKEGVKDGKSDGSFEFVLNPDSRARPPRSLSWTNARWLARSWRKT